MSVVLAGLHVATEGAIEEATEGMVDTEGVIWVMLQRRVVLQANLHHHSGAGLDAAVVEPHLEKRAC